VSIDIYAADEQHQFPIDLERWVALANGTLVDEGVRGLCEVSLIFCDEMTITSLNQQFMGKDGPTDVLSFPLVEPGDAYPGAERLLGDVVISIDTAKRQAAQYDAPLEREVERLLIHGVLHLLGHDHIEPAERATMEAEERRLAAAIGMPWPY